MLNDTPNVRDGPLFFYRWLPILASQHNFFSHSSVSNNFFSIFIRAKKFVFMKKFMNFCTKDYFHALIKDHPLVF